MVKTANDFALLCEEQKKRSTKDKEHAERVKAQRTLLQKLTAELAPRRRTVVSQVQKLTAEDVTPLVEYLVEPEASTEAQQALQAATAEVEAARLQVSSLAGKLDLACSTDRPSAALREAVEAVCVLLQQKPDWASARLRLLRSGRALERRLLAFAPSSTPKIAEARLRDFVGGRGSNQASGGDDVASALRRWVLAILAANGAEEELRVSTVQAAHSLTLTSAVECLANLAGLNLAGEELRSALMLADAFPTDPEAEEESAELELEKLSDKVYQIKVFVGKLTSDSNDLGNEPCPAPALRPPCIRPESALHPPCIRLVPP
jgi:hypothetical protein